jgi:hypothetical protein
MSRLQHRLIRFCLGLLTAGGLLVLIAAPRLTRAAPPVTDYYQITVTADDDNLSGAGAECTLRDALGIVNASGTASASGCTVTTVGTPALNVYVLDLPSYTYTLNGSELLISANTVYVVGDGMSNTILRAAATSGTATYRVLRVTGAATTADLNGVSVLNGHCAGACAGSTIDGGGVRVVNASLTLDASAVSANTATGGGGGISSEGATADVHVLNGSIIGGDAADEGNTSAESGGISSHLGTVIIDASTVSGNSASNSIGGVGNYSGTLTIRNGSVIGGATAAEGNTAAGAGGIANLDGTATIDASTVSGNRATNGDGGGIYNNRFSLATVLTIQNGSVIGGNTAAGGGGGIFHAGGAALTIDASTISGNIADADGSSAGNGGAIYIQVTSSATIQNGSVIGGDTVAEANSAFDGGGIFSGDNNTVTINASTVSGNTATGGGGGGILNIGGSTLTLDASTISGNSAGTAGGGLWNNATMTLQNATVVGGLTPNTSGDDGGGIYNIGTLNIDASTVSNNTAASDGGGIDDDGGTVTIQNNSLIADNTATLGDGGGLDNGGTLTVDNSVFAGNSAGDDGGGIYNGNTATIQNGSIIGGDTAGEANSAEDGGAIYNPGNALTINASTISGNTATGGGGGIFNDTALLRIDSSSISDNTAAVGGAVQFSASGAVNEASVNSSCITGNSATAVNNDSANSQDVTGNWWGAPNGPSGAGTGSGDSVTANINFSGFLTVPPIGCTVVNLLQNGSFEQATGSMPDLWLKKSLKLSATVDGHDCTTSSELVCSMRFKGDSNGSMLMQTVIISGAAGDEYLLTFDSESLNARGGGRYRVIVKVHNNDGSKSKFKINLPPGTTTWSSYQLPITTRKPYNRLEIIIRFNSDSGRAWFDNFVLTPQ